jgi:Ca2+-binding EF-hand superfamily protein
VDVKFVYNAFQRDENGLVSVEEIRFVMENGCNVEPSEIDEIIAYFDKDNDKLISFFGKKF